MADHDSTYKGRAQDTKFRPSRNEGRRTAGGAATGGGINFQGAVTGICYTYMLRGRPLTWLDGIYLDIPVAVAAETGGAGDDIQLSLRGGKTCEAQVKRGLRSGDFLWSPLLKMGRGITEGGIDFGVLVVSPSSSATIREELATAIMRIGGGRQDNLPKIGNQFLEKLTAHGLDPQSVCQALRIVTVAATSNDGASVAATHAELAHVCGDEGQISAAWDALYRDAVELIDLRGRRDISTLAQVLRAREVFLSLDSETPSGILSRLAEWTIRNNSTFTIFGVNKPLRMDRAWIPLQAMVRVEEVGPSDLGEALAAYQSWHEREYSQTADGVDPETLGRFIKLAVVVAGPGMGKTTLLSRVANRYAVDGIPVVKVKLAAVAARMRNGGTFEEAVFSLGLDGSGIAPHNAMVAGFKNIVVLCDGLDETGASQPEVAAAAERFANGHPECRVVVTTRPVGYDASNLSAWRHYDIAPLSSSNTASNLASLLYEIGGEEPEFGDDASEVARVQLEDDGVTKAISRSPLLLALAAALIARGGFLGASRPRLYEQLFALVDEAPNSRVPEPPAEPAVLRRFLDILGWRVAADPLARVDSNLGNCAQILSVELALPPLAAKAAAQRYLRYWQDVGIVERVGQAESEALAFIHKTFGEYAAARYLIAMDDSSRADTLATICLDDSWGEVLNFSALTGLADEVCTHLLANSACDTVGIGRIVRCLEICGEAESPPALKNRALIISRAFDAIRSPRWQWAVDVALSMVPVARRFPDEIFLSCVSLKNHDQSWTRLAAWTLLAAAGRADLDLDYLQRAIVDETIQIVGESWDGRIVLRRNTERDLAQAFVLEASRRLLERLPSEETEEAVVAAFQVKGLGSVGFLRRGERLFEEHGKTVNFWAETRKSASDFLFPPKDFLKAYYLAQMAIFAAIDGENKSGETEAEHGNQKDLSFLALSAFLTLSGYMEMPLNDAWAWTIASDTDAVKETVQATISASGVNREELQRDVEVARARVATESVATSWMLSIASVDVNPIDWSAAASYGPDLAKIEAALYHRSKWVIWMAANLVDSLAGDEAKGDIVRRAIAGGKSQTIWAAAQLAVSRGEADVIETIYERLEKNPSDGCEHLLICLRELKAPPDERLLNALETGFFRAPVDIAMGAVELALHHAIPSFTDLLPILERATEYWEVHEKPYPIEGGVVPKSPRAKIAEARAAIRPLAYEVLKELSADSRSDVREVGIKMLVARLVQQTDLAAPFLTDIEAGAVSANILDKALDQSVAWSEPVLSRVHQLLNSRSTELRRAAMSLLRPTYRSNTIIRQEALRLSGDSDRGVRARAFRILDALPEVP